MNTSPGKAQRLRTADALGSTRGFICAQEYLTNRRAAALCTAVGYLGGHGGDVWIVRHDDGAVAVYLLDDLEPSDAPPVLHPGPAELAADLAAHDLHGCAALVREGHRAAAMAIVEALRGLMMPAHEAAVFAAQVRAWGRSEDDGIARSNAAWRASNGCEACALMALAPSGTRCAACVERESEARS